MLVTSISQTHQYFLGLSPLDVSIPKALLIHSKLQHSSAAAALVLIHYANRNVSVLP